MNSENILPAKRERQNGFVEKLVNGPVEFLIKKRIKPNTLSYLGFLCSIGAACFIALGFTRSHIFFAWVAPLLLAFSGIFDILDGSLARKSGRASKAGAFLDSNLDRISDATLVLGLIYGNLVNYAFGFLLLFITIMISYIRSRAENEGLNMKGVGWMERAERMIFLWIILIVESWIYFLSEYLTGTAITWFFTTMILVYSGLLIITIGQRIFFVFNSLNKENGSVQDD
ncbi:MAG: CDP-alcohol phosphatidyltransferase family protein [Candidatus Lokiarchaeota archaeon]|nr:CDP-alcohol phosphatidyltransferase family protein [Candidatus Lokiarchaeota archaeon]